MFLQSCTDSWLMTVDLFTVDAVIGSGLMCTDSRCLFLMFIQSLVQVLWCFTDTGLQTAVT